MISVQNEDFSVDAQYRALIADNVSDGAVVTFVGMVRDFNDGSDVEGLFLEHYPGMTEKCLEDIVEQAKQRWSLGRVRVIHRVGQLALGDQIVFVGVTGRHRGESFEACEFIMDYLKTQAPFWKKETTTSGERWVEAKQTDQQKADKW
jgi:molybdopterin synthase catalytic subunit